MEKTKWLFGFLVLSFMLVLSMSITSAVNGSVVFSAVPEQSEWLADGETVYKLDVSVDNTGVNPQSTMSLDYKLVFLQHVSLVSYTDYGTESIDLPDYPENDFFEGTNMAFQSANLRESDHIVVSRVANFPSGVVINNEGVAGSYWFTVNEDAPLGESSFEFDFVNSFAGESGAPAQPTVIENVPFTIIDPNASNCPSDFNGDGFVNGADLATLLSNWGTDGADLTNDGITNGADLANLLSNWGECGSSAVTGNVQIDKDSRELLSDFFKQNKRNLGFLSLVL